VGTITDLWRRWLREEQPEDGDVWCQPNMMYIQGPKKDRNAMHSYFSRILLFCLFGRCYRDIWRKTKYRAVN
jgi:hypothetical protein